MQMHGATPIELRLHEMILECESAMPPSEFETRLVVAMSDGVNELQRLRGLLDASALGCPPENT